MNHFDRPGQFTKCPTHMPRETGQSYLGRVAAFFGARNPQRFCRDYSLDVGGIQHGKPEALRQLAAITGADPYQLVRWTPRSINLHYGELNGQLLHTRSTLDVGSAFVLCVPKMTLWPVPECRWIRLFTSGPSGWLP